MLGVGGDEGEVAGLEDLLGAAAVGDDGAAALGGVDDRVLRAVVVHGRRAVRLREHHVGAQRGAEVDDGALLSE